MVLYIFEVVGTDYVKMGFTSGSPWGRIRDGFWKNVHPEGSEGCCGKLAWDNLNLIALVPGDLADEAAVKQAVAPEVGELEVLRLALKVQACTRGCDNTSWELPLFKLWIRLQTHKRESCPASAEPKPACRFCGTRVITRHIKKHKEQSTA